jgi:hypothetical protein
MLTQNKIKAKQSISLSSALSRALKSTLFIVLLTTLFSACGGVLKEEVIFEDGANVLTTMRVEEGDYLAKAISRARIATTFPLHNYDADIEESDEYVWTLAAPIDHLPEYQSQSLLFQALYNLGLEEIEAKLSSDDIFKYNANNTPILTRDISYAIMLGLGITHPDASRKSLIDRVYAGKVLQEKGVGSGWPVSVDRISWIVAAWELYLINGNEGWLRTAFNIASRTIEDDLFVVYDIDQNLFRGLPANTTSAVGVYPEWLTEADIFQSYALSTNALYYQALSSLSKMAEQLNTGGESRYEMIAKSLKVSINEKFWMESSGYYAGLIYGSEFPVQDRRSETLGNAWCILFDIADKEKANKMVQKLPVHPKGAPQYYPHQDVENAEASNSVWLVTQNFWNKAIKKTRNHPGYPHGLYSLFRGTALTLGHKNYYKSDTGLPPSDPIYNHSLSASSTSVGSILDEFIGLNFQKDGIHLNPFIPESMGGEHRIVGLPYRDAILNIRLRGYGDQIYAVFLGQKPLSSNVIPADLTGVQDITVVMTTVKDVTELGFDESDIKKDSSYNEIDPLKVLQQRLMTGEYSIKPYVTMPKTPTYLAFEGNSVVWNVINQADIYHLYRNGVRIATTQRPRELIQPRDYAYYQLQITSDAGLYSYLSKPIIQLANSRKTLIEAEAMVNSTSPINKEYGYSGSGYIRLEDVANSDISTSLQVNEKSTYHIRFRYANGNETTSVKSASTFRNLYVNGLKYDTVVFPQLGENDWDKWGYSNTVLLTIPAGTANLSLRYNINGNSDDSHYNVVHLDYVEIIKIQ